MKLDLATRTHLPPELLALHADWAREGWADAPGFHGLAAFWLDRHLGFRSLLGGLIADAGAVVDRRMDPAAFAPRLSRMGGRLVQELIGHHQIEDEAYFPKLAALEPRLARGFDLLDADHHALHALIDRFVTGANGVLQDRSGGGVAHFADALADFDRLLLRHLTDEEDLIIPVVLKHKVG